LCPPFSLLCPICRVIPLFCGPCLFCSFFPFSWRFRIHRCELPLRAGSFEEPGGAGQPFFPFSLSLRRGSFLFFFLLSAVASPPRGFLCTLFPCAPMLRGFFLSFSRSSKQCCICFPFPLSPPASFGLDSPPTITLALLVPISPLFFSDGPFRESPRV